MVIGPASVKARRLPGRAPTQGGPEMAISSKKDKGKGKARKTQQPKPESKTQSKTK
jgi:hypothetical protein